MTTPGDPSLRKRRHSVHRGYIYLAWKLENPANRDLRTDTARFREAIEAACGELDTPIQHLAIWKTSIHLLCIPSPKRSLALVEKTLMERTSPILGSTGGRWAEDTLSGTISHWALEETRRMMHEPEG